MAERARPGRAAHDAAPRLLYVTTVELTLRAFLLPYADHFRRRGWTVDALARGASTSPSLVGHFDAVHDVEWSRSPWRLDNFTRSLRRVREVVRAGRYDLVHVHTPVAAFLARAALRGLRRTGRGPRVVYTAHGFHFYRGAPPARAALFRGAERLAGRWTDGLLVINPEDHAAALERRIVTDERRVWLVPGVGVDTTTLAAERIDADVVARTRAALGIPTQARVLLFAGEFNPGKRQRQAVAALARLGRADVHLVCAGEGPLRQATRELADSLGVGGQVHLPGFRTDVPALMRMADALLLLSEREGLPRSVLEAMALRVPTIGTRVRGIRDLLGGGCGLLVELDDAAGTAAAIARLLDEPGLGDRLATAAHRRVLEYDLARVLELHEQIYGELLASPTR